MSTINSNNDSLSSQPILKAGCSAYYNSVLGLVRCHVISIRQRDDMVGDYLARILVTGTEHGFYKGEKLLVSSLFVAPRRSVKHWKGCSMRIAPYRVKVDKQARAS